MVFPQKRVFIFLFAAMVLAASPALSVPLSSGVENSGAAAYGTPSYTDPDGETTLPVDGTAGIVDHQTVAMTESHATEEAGPHSEIGMGGGAAMGGGGGMPGWVMPAAGVGAGGGALFAVLSHDKGSGAAASALGASSNLGGNGSGGGITTMGTSNDGTPGGSSDVPEPGTLMLMGAGIASFLGRRRLFSK